MATPTALPFSLTTGTGQVSLVDQLFGLPAGTPNNPLSVNVGFLQAPAWSPGSAVLPGFPAALIQGTVGAGAVINYQVVAVNHLGQDSVPSANLTASNNASPNANNTISWMPVPGAAFYRVLKNGALLATVGAGNVNANFPSLNVFSYTDSAGTATTTHTPSTTNPLAYIPVAAVAHEGQKLTYRAAAFSQAMLTVVGDFFSLSGVASRVIRPRRLSLQIAATAAIGALTDINIYLRTAAYTGGTAGALTNQALDTNDVASSAVANVYSTGTAPTAGAGVLIDSQKYFIPALGGTTVPGLLVFEFGTRNTKPVTLRGAAQFLSANVATTAPGAGAILSGMVEWTDESA